MNRDAYFSRIGLTPGELPSDLETLKLLQTAHLLAVPFENLDIHWKRPIALDIAKFYKKIVEHRRGGFCYELNGLFNELLRDIGFETRLISARVYNGKDDFGHEYNHAAIIVSIGKDEYLADVGFGDFTAGPLRFVIEEKQADRNGVYVIRKHDDEYFKVAKRTGDMWKPEYVFKDTARDLAEFAEMCDFQQYSPESHFTKGKLCSVMTTDGRKTLTDKSFIVTNGTSRTEKQIADEADFLSVLTNEFEIVVHS